MHGLPGMYIALAKSTTTIKHLQKHKNYTEEVKAFDQENQCSNMQVYLKCSTAESREWRLLIVRSTMF